MTPGDRPNVRTLTFLTILSISLRAFAEPATVSRGIFDSQALRPQSGLAAARAGDEVARDAVATRSVAPEPDVGSDELPAHRLKPVVVAASYLPRPIDQVPGTVNVITRDQIERTHYTSVVDMLRHVAGLHVDQPGPRGSRASIYTRGLDPNHTLILIDGVRMNDPTNNRGGSFDLSTLDPAGIERIEIVRGAVSAVHGSDAIAGAVNIITRSGRDGNALALDASGGRWGAHRVSGEARGQHGLADASIAGTWVDEGNLKDGQKFRGGSLKTEVGIQLPRNASLQSTLRFADSKSDSFPDDSGGSQLAVNRTLEERDVSDVKVGVELSQKIDRWFDYAMHFNYRHRREARDVPMIALGVRFPVPSESSRDLLDYYAFSLRNSSEVVENLSVTVGGDVYREEGSSNSVIDAEGALFIGPVAANFELDRVVGSTFGEVQWRGEWGLSLFGGLRVDFPESASTEVTPRFNAKYRVPRIDVLISGNWGEGFKLPAFFSLANPLVGNAGLVAEHSRGWDVGLSREFWNDRVSGRVTYFKNRVKKLIDFDSTRPGPFGFGQIVNRSEVTSQGVEFELDAKLFESLELTGHLTHTSTNIVGSTEKLLDRPRWRGGAMLAWTPTPAVSFRAELLVVGRVEDSSVPTGATTLDTWTRVDLSASWRPREHLTVYLEIDNLLNEEYEEAAGFRAPAIRPRAGIRLRF